MKSLLMVIVISIITGTTSYMAQTSDLYPVVDIFNRIGFNQKGEEVVKPQYTYISYGMYEGDDPILVTQNDKYGFIDKTGKYVIEPQFDIFTKCE